MIGLVERVYKFTDPQQIYPAKYLGGGQYRNVDLMLLKDSQDKVRKNLDKEYVQYDATDTGYMLTQYDSNVATKWSGRNKDM